MTDVPEPRFVNDPPEYDSTRATLPLRLDTEGGGLRDFPDEPVESGALVVKRRGDRVEIEVEVEGVDVSISLSQTHATELGEHLIRICESP